MVTRTKLWTPSNRFSELAGVYRSVLEILDRIDGSLSTRTDDDTGVVTVISDSNDGHGITTASTVDVYWQSGQRIGMSVSAVTNKAVTVDGGDGDALPTLNDYVWVKVQGAGGTIFPLGDHIHGALTGSTLTTIGEQQVTVTASEAWNAWDVPAGRFVGILPYLDFNGTDEEADTPDIPYFTFSNNTLDTPLTIGVSINISATAAIQTILAKWATGNREWRFQVISNETLTAVFFDDNANETATRISDAALTLGQWILVVMTYSGLSGASAMDEVALYEDGAVIASTATNNASYVAMQGGTAAPQLGRRQAANFFAGKMAIPFIIPRELTADNIAMLDHIIRGAAGLT